MIDTLAQALAARGYDVLTDVQTAVTDPALSTRDLLVSAQTGSGKTVGFGLAIAPTILPDTGQFDRAATPLALVIAPTRELAFQVKRELAWLYEKAGAVVTTCVGGMDMRDERRALDRGAHVVVATPGRLRDHIQRGSVDLSGLRAVVLDEADEMLDLGFSEDLEFILAAAPDDRRTLMFSATVPPAIAKLARTYQRDAERVQVSAGKGQHADIAYQAMAVSQTDAENAIINVLRFHDAENALVFANTRAMVARLTARFLNRGFAVVSLSGELSQTERTHALQAMRDGRARVCVATDVAARGIDLPGLDLVVHAELPSNPETLLHRSGRTGRAGRKGISALIVPPRSRSKAERLLRFAKLQAEWTVPPSADDILQRDEARLLGDPAWSEPVTEAEAAFAAQLVARHSPEQVAAAYLRLYRKGVSAPEDLSAPDAPEPRRERAPFGPSQWVSLPVGRAQRAEPRWLLPLLCRAGNIDKTVIGAIRVQQDETFVELSKPAVPAFLEAIGPGRQLEEGMVLTVLEGEPDLAAAPAKDARPPKRDGAPRPRDRDAHADSAPSKPRAKPSAPPAPAAAPETRPAQTERAFDPAQADAQDAAPRKPRSKGADGPAPKRAETRPPKGTAGKPPRRPREDGSGAHPGKAPGKRPGGAAPTKSWSKPAGDARPAPARASDTSKRFTPPGQAASKPGGKPAGGKQRAAGPKGAGGGNAFPRRGKS